MKPEQIIKAWKDENYRKSLSEAERAALPENPAGLIELSDAELGDIGGGARALPETVECTRPWMTCSPVFCNFTKDGGTLCPTKATATLL
ncbi:MAG TPA: mersacidin/lichenicidin family type 2 lantibiotic [Anaeromyxobacteraceae bacterium]|nr:mersacidin/lichenicidin family type 2 lantibiotic [Anaeromyxobacteraceae bacterium]